MDKGRYHWSNLARPVLFFVVHWVAALPWFLLIFYQSWMVIGIALSSLLALLYIRFKLKMTLASAWRAVIGALTGREKATSNLFKNFVRGR